MRNDFASEIDGAKEIQIKGALPFRPGGTNPPDGATLGAWQFFTPEEGTTVEAIVDLLSPEWHERAKIAKDVSAGAVLILGVTAIIVGFLILGPPLWERIFPLIGQG